MWQVRQAQLDALTRASEAALVRWLADHLLKRCADELARLGHRNLHEVRQLAQFGVADVKAKGIRTEQDVTRYVEFSIVVAPTLRREGSLEHSVRASR